MRRWRWRLARLFAPEPIIGGPHGEDGVWLYGREGQAEWWITTTSLDVKMSATLADYALDGPDDLDFTRRSRGTFNGTI